jgi:hypothetical protein
MDKKIIEKEVTEYGTIHLNFYHRDGKETMFFDDKVQFETFVYLLKMMVESDAESIIIG